MNVPRGTVLDVGCGDGAFLSFMRRLGWRGTGVEPDPAARKVAVTERGLDVREGRLEDSQFQANTFDAVTLSHVIEHVSDPISLLKECYRITKPEGKLVILTPNVESLGHKFFRNRWRGLEPPRHLLLFSKGTLSRCVKESGFAIDRIRTISRLAVTFWTHRMRTPQTHHLYGSPPSPLSALGGIAFYFLEELARSVDEDAGEEVLLIGDKARS